MKIKISVLITVLFILMLFCNNLFANFNIEKLNEFGFAQEISDHAIIENYFIAQMDFGIEIYEILENSELVFCSRFTSPSISEFLLFEEYIYLVSNASELDNFPDKILKINISDKYNPFLSSEIELTDNYDFLTLDIYNNNLLLRQQVALGDFIYHFYDIDTLTELSVNQCSTFIFPINYNLAFSHNNYNNLSIYDFSDTENWQPVGNVDLTEHHAPEHCIFQIETINDTIAICASDYMLSFWDMNSSTEWEYISSVYFESSKFYTSFTFIEDKIIIPTIMSIDIISIEDIYNPQMVSSYLIELPAEFLCIGSIYENYYYLSSHNNGIQIFEIIDDDINFIDEFCENPTGITSKRFENYLFIYSLNFGIDVYDISNPLVPLKITTLFEDNFILQFDLIDNEMLVSLSENDACYIYDITDPLSLELISIRNGMNHKWAYRDETDLNSLYLYDFDQKKMSKYDISESIEAIFLCETNLPDNSSRYLIYDNHIYAFISYGANNYVTIYEITEENQINMVVDQQFLCHAISANFFIENSFLTIYPHRSYYGENFSSTFIFSLENPAEPTLVYELENSGKPQFYENLIFTCSGHTSYIYDTNNVINTQLNSIGYFNNYSLINNIYFFDDGISKYLYLVQRSMIGIFEFEYETDSPENEITQILHNLTNYPNPFNPTRAGRSSSTTISFSCAESVEKAEIEIFNIKGQKMKTIKCEDLSLGDHNVTWNGEDNNNQIVSSGVYFYKLIINKKIVSFEKMMLLK